jgi:hypothetical protein
MKYVLETQNKTRFLLSQKERDGVMKAISKKAKFVQLQGSLLPLQIIPTLTPFDKWYHAENMKLGAYGKRLCKFCLMPMDKMSGCPCWSKNGGQEQDGFNPIELPENVKKSLAALADGKAFPEIEQLAEPDKPVEYIEGEQLGYKNEESGETFYS